MLTPERHQLIMTLLHAHHNVKMQDLVLHTGASESTIRRDLDQLEKEGKLRRVHGGASIRQRTLEEPSVGEKLTKYHDEKKLIGKYAASVVRNGDCIFIDAGTTTMEMIPHLQGKDIIAVTNGLNQLESLTDYQVKTYMLGGYVKHKTRAVIGTQVLEALAQYRFDQCFLGANGISLKEGFTTPDPEEASIKYRTLSLSQESYILADHSKFDEVSFCKIADLNESAIITNYQGPLLKQFQEKTNIKVVTT
ncbi:DeoR/GlpR family DNA-binding transcription regulator [Halobacillus salinarum]|uniref:DeoR/GlpR family DNA-binding transcription regulator n=1 Tax=Halobacillus salinarum TaxID=2932257 RepID=A0ABY4EN43_9BACI|nr:DeoR/GlpR family DNA-binding transcription regulator [Halobacillus salinarum]UOQ45878.1 DeoR/GlpR family DNA-binding transcription regulator [Halobacillus salinarum]